MDLSSETIQNDLNLHYTTRRLQRRKVIEYKWNDELKKGDVHYPTLDLYYFYKVLVSNNDSHLIFNEQWYPTEQNQFQLPQ